MKKIFNKFILAAAVAPALLTACMEEALPTDIAITEQLGANTKAIQAVVRGVPAYMKNFNTWFEQPFDFGYPSEMIIRDMYTGDIFQRQGGGQFFFYWSVLNRSIDSDMGLSQMSYYYMNFMVNACNEVIRAIDENTDNPEMMMYLAQALAFRASTYLDMARCYEFLPNDALPPLSTEGKNILNLTVPVTVPGMDAEESSNNPRLPREQMLEFLLGDLQKAESLFERTSSVREIKNMPDLAVVYGLMARTYMWVENYPQAAVYARRAIAASNATPLSNSQWNDPTNGFNDMSVSSWMWGIQQNQEDEAVQSEAWCWGSFMVSETKQGFAGYRDSYMTIDKRLYESIDDRDFRKLSWVAPSGSPLSGKEVYTVPGANYPAYTSLKFRANDGNTQVGIVCMAQDIPLMRVEEMYLIEAEATAQTNPTEGKRLLESFMQQYRYDTYTCMATDREGIIDECFKQKQIELWGEGQIMFDYKRLNKSVVRFYDGTNWPDNTLFNTVGRPAWMNYCLAEYEASSNAGVRGYLNPNVSSAYTLNVKK